MEEAEKKTTPCKTNCVLKNNVLPYLRDLTKILTVILIVFLVVFRMVIVSGDSMKNTLKDGDYLLLLNNLFYTDPQRGDIVVISKESFDNGNPIIKRVIATEGQTVDINFELGIVYVNGEPIQEPYTLSLTNIREGMDFPLVVNEGCVFVLGDNRNRSRDSRDPAIGQIDKREILGKAILLFFPGPENSEGERDFTRIGGLG